MNPNENRWRVSSNGEWIDPREYPYLVDWVNQVKQWVQDFKINEFIRADDEGFDPSGRVARESNLTTDLQSKAPIPAGLIWSSTGLAEYYISTELNIGANFGDHMVFGWYIGQVSHQSAKIFIDSMMHVCKVCLGTGFVFVPENFAMDDGVLQMGFEIWLDDDGAPHSLPLDKYTPLKDEGEVEYDCRENICKDNWIYIEDTDKEILRVHRPD